MLYTVPDWYECFSHGESFAVGFKSDSSTLWDSVTPARSGSEKGYFTIEHFSDQLRSLTLSGFETTYSFFYPLKSFTSIHPHSNFVYSFKPSSDQSLIVSGGERGDLRVFATASGDVVKTYEGHVGDINHCSFFPSDKVLLSCSTDLSIRIWDLFTTSCARIIHPHTASILKVLPIDSGKEIVSIGKDDCVVKTVVASKDQLWKQQVPCIGDVCLMSSDEAAVLSCNGSIHIIALDSGSITDYYDFSLTSPKCLAIATNDDSKVFIVGGDSAIAIVTDSDPVTIPIPFGVVRQIEVVGDDVYFSEADKVVGCSLSSLLSSTPRLDNIRVYQAPKVHDVYHFEVGTNIWISTNVGYFCFSK
ncbi:hypothetical protein GEMRC1_009107 [Eukaryota sp. GEM-RC1]